MTNKSPTHPKITRSQYKALKRTLINIEKYNTSYIYFIPCAGDKNWHEIAEHSALIFYYEVAKRLGLSHNFYADVDLSNPYAIGYIRSQGVDSIIEFTKQAGLYKGTGYDSHRIFYIELKKTFSEEKIEHYHQLEQERRAALGVINPARNLAPDFYQLITKAGHSIHATCNNHFSKLVRTTAGQDVFALIFESLELYHKIVLASKTQRADIIDAWRTIRKNLYDASIKCKTLCDFRLIKKSVDIVSLVDTLQALRRMAEREIAKLKKPRKTNQKNTKNTKRSTNQ